MKDSEEKTKGENTIVTVNNRLCLFPLQEMKHIESFIKTEMQL